MLGAMVHHNERQAAEENGPYLMVTTRFLWSGESGENWGDVESCRKDTSVTPEMLTAVKLHGNLSPNGGSIYCSSNNATLVLDDASATHNNRTSVEVQWTLNPRVFSHANDMSEVPMEIL